MNNQKKRILSGIQPTGSLHLGNYFGMMKPAIEMQSEGECFYFIANYHAVTQLPDAETLKQRTLNVAIDFLASGLDPERTTFFRQSDVPEVTELAWILNCVVPVGLLERCHSYKDKIARGLPANHGLFSYPVLMASDILIYDSHLVPVGQDQKQHLEVTRDIATRFNNAYGELLVLPDARIREEVASVPGIDGRKMSKSYDNTIDLADTKKVMRKKFMRVVTDSTPLEEPKDPDSCNVSALYKLFAFEDEAEDMRQRYRAGGLGYGHAKQEAFDQCWEYLEPFRERREQLVADIDSVQDILKAGASRARAVAQETLTRVRTAIGLD